MVDLWGCIEFLEKINRLKPNLRTNTCNFLNKVYIDSGKYLYKFKEKNAVKVAAIETIHIKNFHNI